MYYDARSTKYCLSLYCLELNGHCAGVAKHVADLPNKILGGGGGGYITVYFVGVYFCCYEFLAVRLSIRTTKRERTRDNQVPC
jgi:hypothetical protein